jgi:RND family efflux transporter MFP subunit
VAHLYQDSVATLEQFQNAKTGLDVASKQLEAARFNRSFSEIRAVSNGFVLRKMASEGQVISSGITVFQTNGAKEGKWILKTGVSDREWSSVNVGDKAVITTDALPGKSFDAKVTRKSESTDASTGSFTIELTLIQSQLPLASGLFGKAAIAVTHTPQSWSIPYDALLDGNEQTGYVFVTSDNKTAQKIKVNIGGLEHDQLLISSGLETATALIVSGSAYLRDGSAIKVIP